MPIQPLTEAKISTKTGYFMAGDAAKDSDLPDSRVPTLSTTPTRSICTICIEMAESRAEEIDRISCEEEERVSRGFDIQTYFSVDGGQVERVRKAVALSSESALLNLRYVPAARLVHVNKQWRSAKSEGFPMGHDLGRLACLMPEA